VPADDIRVNPAAQRDFRPAWANDILSNFDIEKFQVPHVAQREDGTLYALDGQHSIWAYREYFGEGQQVQVWLHERLTEQGEADLFLALNNKKAVDGLAKFKVGVTAGRETECDIDRIVRANGCYVGGGGNNQPNAIQAVAALYKLYSYSPEILGKTLRIIRDSFNRDGGFERPILLGIGMVLARYPQADEERLVSRLSALRNGWNGVIQKATAKREATGCRVDEGAAAAVVDVYNSGRGGRKLPSWWNSDKDGAA